MYLWVEFTQERKGLAPELSYELSSQLFLPVPSSLHLPHLPSRWAECPQPVPAGTHATWCLARVWARMTPPGPAGILSHPLPPPPSRTERPHPVPLLSQGRGEQARTRHRQIQTHRCTQRRPQACAPERHRRSHRLRHIRIHTHTHPKKLVGTHHWHRSLGLSKLFRFWSSQVRRTHPQSLSVVLKPDLSPHRTGHGSDQRSPGVGGRRQKEWRGDRRARNSQIKERERI